MSDLRRIARLPNMIDVSEAEIARVQNAANACLRAFDLRGYERIETPIIEETELFLRKSGGELSSKLYAFEEPGGFRTSLRPEYTAPVIRHAIESGDAGTRTCRYQYFGPVFRYAMPEHQYGAKPRQFNQLGAEMIGAPPFRADGEIIAMAVEGLNSLGVKSPTIALGHVGLLRSLMAKFELGERSGQFLLANAGRISKGSTEDVLEDAERLGLLGSGESNAAPVDADIEQIKRVIDRSLGPLGANAGSRTRDEVVARLARKQIQADSPENFKSALSMLSELTAIIGAADTCIAEGRRLASESDLDPGCFDLLENVVTAAVDEGVNPSAISIRFGLARGVAYYTGMLFDILPDPDAAESLGGGGRYDGLTRALGLDADVPALGFAYSLDAVAELVAESSSAGSSAEPMQIVPADADSWPAAATAAAGLREKGTAAVLQDVPDPKISSRVIIVTSDGKQTEQAAT